MTSGLETEWDDSGRNRTDGQKKKIGKANKKRKKEKIKTAKDKSEWTRKEKKRKGYPGSTRGTRSTKRYTQSHFHLQVRRYQIH